MEVLEIENSSAISKISFNFENNEVGVAYTYKPDNFYVFYCDEIENIKTQIQSAESVGKLISQLRKDGTLQTLSNTENSTDGR
jgi:hypothetical protein